VLIKTINPNRMKVYIIACITIVAILISSCSAKESSEMINGEEIFGNVEVVTTHHYELTDSFGSEEAGEKLSKKVYEYDENVKLTQRRDYNENDELTGSIKYYYDEDDNFLTKAEILSPDGIVENELIYTTNEYGRILEMDYLNSDGTLSFKEVHQYNNSGNRYETSTYMSSGRLLDIENFKYNNDGILIENKRYDRDESLRGHITFKIDEYDSMGNWTIRKIYSSEEPIEMVKREIVYR